MIVTYATGTTGDRLRGLRRPDIASEAIRRLSTTARSGAALRKVVLATGWRKFARAGRANLALKLAPTGRSALHGAHQIKVKLTLAFRPRGGKLASTTTTAITLKR